MPSLQVIATGSSSFDLANQINEPLTGRTYTYHLYPISIEEMIENHGVLSLDQQLNQRLIYGMYPQSVLSNDEKTLI
jgi:predicted AAA+ superfamily ATPase